MSEENESRPAEAAPDLSADLQSEIEVKRTDLLHSVKAGQLDTIQERVAWILNHYSEARNSDIELQIKFWETFQPELATGEFVRKADLYKLTRFGSLSRARAKIQNTYNLFKAHPEIQRHRGVLSKEEFAKSQQQRSSYPQYSVFVDESGKSDGRLLVGSLWFLHPPDLLSFVRGIGDFKINHGFKGEFHFKEVKSHNLEIYMKFADWLSQKASVVSFKAVCVARAGIKYVPDVVEKLHYHLIVRGVEHEHDSGRATLPRSINFIKDSEEEGRDRVMMAGLVDQVKNASSLQFDGKLEVGDFEARDSKEYLPLQVADLYSGCLNRVMNFGGEQGHPKDILSRHFLKLLGLPNGLQDQESQGGVALLVSL